MKNKPLFLTIALFIIGAILGGFYGVIAVTFLVLLGKISSDISKLADTFNTFTIGRMISDNLIDKIDERVDKDIQKMKDIKSKLDIDN